MLRFWARFCTYDVAQLERDILIERVKNGLANAKTKGVQLGRKKTRDSELIRRLYLTGITYREIGRIAKCSSGAVSAEVRDLKKDLTEKQGLEKALREREYEFVKVELERTRSRVATLECKVPAERPRSTSGNWRPAPCRDLTGI